LVSSDETIDLDHGDSNKNITDHSNLFKKKQKRIRFSNSLCGACVSPPNERIPSSWNAMFTTTLRLITCLDATYSRSLQSKLISTLPHADRIICSQIINYLTNHINITQSLLNKIIENSNLNYFTGVHSLTEGISLIGPEISLWLNPKSQDQERGGGGGGGGGLLDSNISLLRYRISWGITSVLKAKLRWLLDPTYPTITSGAEYSYDNCRSGLIDLLEIQPPDTSLFDIYSGEEELVENKKQAVYLYGGTELENYPLYDL